MVVVQYILPALRVAIAKELVEDYGMRRVDVAESMGVTPAAITQYLNTSRGGRTSAMIDRSDQVQEEIHEIARALAKGDTPVDVLLFKLCKTCQTVRNERLLCDLHIEAMPSLGKIEACACSIGLAGWGRDQGTE